jgi:UDP-glucose-4-epimerase GalE
MSKAKVQKLVFSSSCAVYGEPKVLDILETQMPNPINPYGFSKLACEKLIEYCGESQGINSVVLRFFNAVGADPDGEIGETHLPETHMIPLALKAAITESPFRVFGGDYATKDGSAVRDFIHVSDLATAHVLSLKKLLEGSESFTCNLGTGLGHSVLEIATEIKKRFPKFEYTLAQRRPGDPAQLVANKDLSKKILSFSPKYSDIGTILETALFWEQNQGRL